MKMLLSNMLKNYITAFAKFYHHYRVEAEGLRAVKYRIISTLDDYHRTRKIELCHTDKPGDILPVMTIEEIKKSIDIISGMHPVDVNSINDLLYLSRDQVVEMKIMEDSILIKTDRGDVVRYNLSDEINPDLFSSPRVAYMIGYMQAEKIIKDIFSTKIKYRVIRDNISSIHVEDTQNGSIYLKNPMDILFSKEYQNYSKDDVARIGVICGQLSNTH